MKKLLLFFTLVLLLTITCAIAVETTKKKSWFEQFKATEDAQEQLLKEFPVESQVEPLKNFLQTQPSLSFEKDSDSELIARQKASYALNPVVQEWIIVVKINNKRIQNISVHKYLTSP